MQLSNVSEQTTSVSAERAPTHNEREIFASHHARTALCKELRPGARVLTDYSGRVTPHEIRETDNWKQSASGRLFKVYPPVPGSAGSWMDSGWFIPEEKA